MEDDSIQKKPIKPALRRKMKPFSKVKAANSIKDIDEEFKIKKIVLEKSEVRRNPKRQIGVKNYEEVEEPEDDRYVYCDNCEEVFVDNCTECGQLSYLQDDKVDMGVENRAKLTLPKSVLCISPSPIHGLGIFARVPLKKGIKMGPYEGKITKVENTTGYSWKLRDGRLVDGADEKFSNWMRYINCARHHEEQNLVAFQFKGNLYYRTCRDIGVGQELLVYYGQSFAENLGIDVRNYFKPKEEKIWLKSKCCTFCNYGYKDIEKLRYHMKVCRWNPDNVKKIPEKIFYCKFCPAGMGSKDDCMKHEKRCGRNKYRKIGEAKKMDNQKERTLEETIFHCENCNYSTNIRKNLLGHQNLHNKFFKFTCKICEKGCNRYQNLRNHMLKHLNVAKHITILRISKELDGKVTKNIIEVDFSEFKINIVKYECGKCNYATPTITHIKDHLKTHSKRTIFLCFSCEYTSANMNEVREHLKNNHDYTCRDCNGDEFCGKHIKKKVVNEEGHTCGICGLVTIQRSHLKSHIEAIHLEERNYKCQLCDYSATQKIHLKEHINSKHFKSEEYECSQCDFHTFYRHYLRCHIKRRHEKISI